MRDEAGGADGSQIKVGGGLADRLICFRVLRQGDQDAVGAQDTGLLPGDLGDRIAQIVLVVERDIGDDRNQGVNDIRRVETAPKPYLQNCDVDRLRFTGPFSREVKKSKGRQDLEEARRMGKLPGFDQAAGGLVDLEVELCEVLVRNLGAVDLDALVNTDQVGRGVETGAVTRRGQDTGQGGGRGAFAVGSGNQNRGEAGLRMAQSGSQNPHVGEVELAAGRAGRGRGKFVAQSVEMVDRSSIGHGPILGECAG